MTIQDAAITVLRDAGHPLTPADIHKEIVRRGLFTFSAKDPVAIVGQTLRKKSQTSDKSSQLIFVKYANNTYGLAEWTK